MFAFKDLDIFKTHAAILTPPLFAAAYITDKAKTDMSDFAPMWLVEHPWLILQIIGWGMFLLLATLAVWIVFLLVDTGIAWIDAWIASLCGSSLVFLWLGTSSITAGLLILLVVFNQTPVLVLNPFWHLGFIAYGFTMMERWQE
jgi:hypothetical protein